MYCSKCGTMLSEGAVFCHGCGQPVSGPPAINLQTRPVASFSPFAYAGFWLRAVAHLIDGILAGIAFAILVLIAVAIVGVGVFKNLIQHADNPPDELVPEIILIVLIFAAICTAGMWIYYAWMESSSSQGTLGKMALGLIVTDLYGNRITFAHASGRFFAKIITGLIPFGIGYIMAGFTEKKQALHDMIAGCLVLRKA
jgi:uncharacterized RDD family membrane protein YckC